MTDFLDKLRAAQVARQAIWGPESKITRRYRANKLCGEWSEAYRLIRKLERGHLDFKDTETTVEALAEELADVLICLDLVAADYGVDLKQAVTKKFDKTSRAVGIDVYLGTRELEWRDYELWVDGEVYGMIREYEGTYFALRIPRDRPSYVICENKSYQEVHRFLHDYALKGEKTNVG